MRVCVQSSSYDRREFGEDNFVNTHQSKRFLEDRDYQEQLPYLSNHAVGPVLHPRYNGEKTCRKNKTGENDTCNRNEIHTRREQKQGVSTVRTTGCESLGAHGVNSNECEPPLIPWFTPRVHSDRYER